MSTKQRRRGDTGFTLVELLVGLALTAVAAALLLEVIGTGGSATRRSERMAAATESVSTVQALLRERIELLSADGDDDVTGPRRNTQGDSRRFSFIAPSLGNRTGNGLARYFVSLDRNGVLDLAVIDARQVPGEGARWQVLPLLDDVRAIEWSYYGADVAGGAALWRSAWSGRDDPPRLVRLRLRFAGGDPRSWAELVARPATTISTACDLDPTTGTCRES